MPHLVPDPPTHAGCTSCDPMDLRHGLRVGQRVILIAPMTARLTGAILAFALDCADLLIDGREYPLSHVHCQWLRPEEA